MPRPLNATAWPLCLWVVLVLALVGVAASIWHLSLHSQPLDGGGGGRGRGGGDGYGKENKSKKAEVGAESHHNHPNMESSSPGSLHKQQKADEHNHTTTTTTTTTTRMTSAASRKAILPHEWRGFKRYHQGRSSDDALLESKMPVYWFKPLPWEVDFSHIMNQSFPQTTTLLGRKSLVGLTSLQELRDKYAVLHARIMRGEVSPRYVVFESNPEFGYGNKVQVLISTFVFALMSERAILIDWPESHDVEIKHRGDFKGPPPKVTNLDHRELFDPPHGIAWDLNSDLRARFQQARNQGSAKEFKLFTTVGVCNDLFEWEHDTEWVYIRHWDFFATLLLNNQHHENINHLLKPFHEQLFFVISNVLGILKPTAPVRNTVQSLRDSLLAPYRDYGVLGIHLRTSHPEIVVDDQLLVTMIHCALSSGYKVWYLATESQQWRNKFAQLLEMHDTGLVSDKMEWNISNSVSGHRVQLLSMSDDQLDRNTAEGIRNALIDMHFLMACDDFMMLWSTTFGRVVAALGGFKEPITIMKHQRFCVRKLTSEPCIYTWNKLKKAPCYNHFMQLPSMLYSSDALCREF